MRKAVIYARVSTKDQEEFGHSIPAQLKGLQEYAKRHNFEVIKEFAFSEKRKLVSLICQNLTLTDGIIGYTLKKPFELFLEEPKSKVWLGDLDSNQG